MFRLIIKLVLKSKPNIITDTALFIVMMIMTMIVNWRTNAVGHSTVIPPSLSSTCIAPDSRPHLNPRRVQKALQLCLNKSRVMTDNTIELKSKTPLEKQFKSKEFNENRFDIRVGRGNRNKRQNTKSKNKRLGHLEGLKR